MHTARVCGASLTFGLYCVAEKLRAKWNSIRSSFARELRNEKSSAKSGSGKCKRAMYKYTRNLAFLRAHMKLKSMQDNYANDEVTLRDLFYCVKIAQVECAVLQLTAA